MEVFQVKKIHERRNNMKLKNIKDVEGLFKVIDQCQGKVELVTEEGDRLNLKSRLSQYVALVNVFADVKIGELELVAYEDGDVAKIAQFVFKDAGLK